MSQHTGYAAGTLSSGLAASPRGALIVGLAGLIPFVALALGIALRIGNIPVMSAALLTYGGIILSFLGGIRWGFAVKAERGYSAFFQFGMSVLPALLGWWAMFLPLPLGFGVLATGLAVWFVFERLSPAPSAVPSWYVALRAVLTLGAASSLILAAVFW